MSAATGPEARGGGDPKVEQGPRVLLSDADLNVAYVYTAMNQTSRDLQQAPETQQRLVTYAARRPGSSPPRPRTLTGAFVTANEQLDKEERHTPPPLPVVAATVRLLSEGGRQRVIARAARGVTSLAAGLSGGRQVVAPKITLDSGERTLATAAHRYTARLLGVPQNHNIAARVPQIAAHLQLSLLLRLEQSLRERPGPATDRLVVVEALRFAVLYELALLSQRGVAVSNSIQKTESPSVLRLYGALISADSLTIDNVHTALKTFRNGGENEDTVDSPTDLDVSSRHKQAERLRIVSEAAQYSEFVTSHNIAQLIAGFEGSRRADSAEAQIDRVQWFTALFEAVSARGGRRRIEGANLQNYTAAFEGLQVYMREPQTLTALSTGNAPTPVVHYASMLFAEFGLEHPAAAALATAAGEEYGISFDILSLEPCALYTAVALFVFQRLHPPESWPVALPRAIELERLRPLAQGTYPDDAVVKVMLSERQVDRKLLLGARVRYGLLPPS